MIFHAVGGTDHQVHLAVSIPPTAHYLNQRIVNRNRFAWQAGYGVVSSGSKDLPWVTDYIRNQREPHAAGQIHDRLERIDASGQPRS